MMRLIDIVESSSRKRSRPNNKNDSPTKENVSQNIIPHHEKILDPSKGTSTIAITYGDLFVGISSRKRGRPRKQTNSSITDNKDMSKCKNRPLEVLNSNQSLTISDFTNTNPSTPVSKRHSTPLSDITNNLDSTRRNLQYREGQVTLSPLFRQNYDGDATHDTSHGVHKSVGNDSPNMSSSQSGFNCSTPNFCTFSSTGNYSKHTGLVKSKLLTPTNKHHYMSPTTNLTNSNPSTPINKWHSTPLSDITNDLGCTRLNPQCIEDQRNFVATNPSCTRLNLQSRGHDQGTNNDSPEKENVSQNIIPHHEKLLDRNKGTSTIAITSEDLFMGISSRKRGRPRKQTIPSITDNKDMCKCKNRSLEVLNSNQSLTISDFTNTNPSTPVSKWHSTPLSDITNNLGCTQLNPQCREDQRNFVATNPSCTGLNLQSRGCDQGTLSSLFQHNRVAKDTGDAMEGSIDDGDATSHTFDSFPSEYLNLGPPTEVCEFCGALMWKEERNNKSQKGKKCTFSMCCKVGEIKLTPQRPTPAYLKWLIFNSDHFRNNVRAYNSLFSFTSTGGIVDHNINKGRGPYCYRINGQNIHLLGSLLPPNGRPPKFCQLYIYDTENEVENRVGALHGDSSIDPNIVDGLMKMLDENNELAKGFRMARDRFQECGLEELKLIFISSRSASGRPNHIGPSNEVGALLVGASDDQTCAAERDIVVESKEGRLHRVYETNKFFMALQYPLLFPHGESGFHLKIPYNTVEGRRKKKREHVTIREWYSYDLMFRPLQGYTRRLGGRLYQQYIVDAYCAIEQYRLNWIQDHQETLRTDLYKSVRDAISRGDNDPNHIGKSYILPASFTGSRRYMSQYFQDSFAICRTIGHPSIFLTMTCNTKWPEIKAALELMPGVRPEDCPDLIARIFKLKLEQLLDEIRNKNFFGRCIGVMYVIEFQKRGLPHVHMLIRLHPDDRPKCADEIDKIVSAEIPKRDEDPLGYETVKQFMIHGPCGDINQSASCMQDKKCNRHFPKRPMTPTSALNNMRWIGLIKSARRYIYIYIYISLYTILADPTSASSYTISDYLPYAIKRR